MHDAIRPNRTPSGPVCFRPGGARRNVATGAARNERNPWHKGYFVFTRGYIVLRPYGADFNLRMMSCTRT
jgi:hypothetical protein